MIPCKGCGKVVETELNIGPALALPLISCVALKMLLYLSGFNFLTHSKISFEYPYVPGAVFITGKENMVQIPLLVCNTKKERKKSKKDKKRKE